MISPDELHDGIAKLGLSLSSPKEGKLLAYLELLRKWNRVYNLTAIREDEKLIPYHLLDSLAIAPHVTGRSLIDIGTGAGLPGMPLAIANPHLRVVLLDSNHKKTAFLRQTVAELGLPNVVVAAERAEIYQPNDRFDAAVSRAFSDLKTFVESSRHLIRSDGLLMAMKGLYPNEELDQLPSDIKLKEVVQLSIPGLSAERHLVLLSLAASGATA